MLKENLNSPKLKLNYNNNTKNFTNAINNTKINIKNHNSKLDYKIKDKDKEKPKTPINTNNYNNNNNDVNKNTVELSNELSDISCSLGIKEKANIHSYSNKITGNFINGKKNANLIVSYLDTNINNRLKIKKKIEDINNNNNNKKIITRYSDKISESEILINECILNEFAEDIKIEGGLILNTDNSSLFNNNKLIKYSKNDSSNNNNINNNSYKNNINSIGNNNIITNNSETNKHIIANNNNNNNSIGKRFQRESKSPKINKLKFNNIINSNIHQEKEKKHSMSFNFNEKVLRDNDNDNDIDVDNKNKEKISDFTYNNINNYINDCEIKGIYLYLIYIFIKHLII